MARKIYFFFLSLFFLLVLWLFSVALINYEGKKIVYFLFSIILNLLLFMGFRKKKVFFDTFVGIFFWLGFWLKFSFHVAFSKRTFGESVGLFDYSPLSYDSALIITITGVLGFILASLFRDKILFNYSNDARLIPVGMIKFYIKYRHIVLFLYFVLIILIGYFNGYLGLYQRGVVPKTILPFKINGVFKWLLLFGLTSITSILLHVELVIKKRFSFLLIGLGLFETFSSSTSMLSRGMILNSVGVGIGALECVKRRGLQLTRKIILLTIALFCLLFTISVLTVHQLRPYYFGNVEVGQLVSSKIDSQLPQDDSISAKLLYLSKGTTGLFVGRWVGIEGVAAISSYPDKGWSLWKKAWEESYTNNGTSFYDRVILTSGYKQYSQINKQHFITLPGILGFFFYPGSYIFLFASMLFLGIFGASIEIFAYKLSSSNLIFSALMAQVIAYRYAHFGYVPRQSYLLFGSIILTILMIYIFQALFDIRFGSMEPRKKVTVG